MEENKSIQKKIIIVDTNILLVPFQFKVDIISDLKYLLDKPHKYVISSRTLNELKKIGEQIGKDGMAARVALKTIEANKFDFEIIENNMPVDSWILKYSVQHNAYVATNDAALRMKLKSKRVRVISLKGTSKLGFA